MYGVPLDQLPEVEIVKKVQHKVGRPAGSATLSRRAKKETASATGDNGFSKADVQDFPALYKGESKESTNLRVAAFHKICGELRGRFESIQPEANRSTFEQVKNFARANHVSGKGGGDGQVPVGILYAGGVNPSDHTRTFTALRDFLSENNFYVSLVNGRELTAQDGHRSAFRKILMGFSGLKTEADDFLGLMHWYEDTTKSGANPKGGSSGTRKVAKSPGTSRKRKTASGDVESTPRRVTRALSRDVRANPEETVAPKRYATEEIVQGTQDGGSADRPLVVVIDDGESADPKCFTDLVHLLSDARPRLKITLVVGMSTNSETLQRFILLDAPYRVCCRKFALTPSRRCLEQAFRQVLISIDGPFVVLGKDLSDALTDQHLYHDSTIEGFKQGLLLACTHHFAREPLSGFLSVLANPLGGGNSDWKDIPEDLLKFAGRQLKVGRDESLATLMASCIQKVTAWKLGLTWIHEIASNLGKMTRASGCTWRDLYCAGVGDRFGDSPGFALVEALATQSGLQRLSNEELSSLLSSLESITMEYEKLSLQMGPYIRKLKGFREEVHSVTDDPPEEKKGEECCSGENKNQATRGRVERQQPISTGPQTRKKTSKLSARRSARARRELLMESFAATPPTAASAVPQTSHSKVAAKIGEFLREAIQEFCGSPPERIRGSRVFSFGGGDAVRHHLLGAPRLSLERALAHPKRYMANALSDEDLSVAYQTYKATLGERLNLADWFLAFSSHFHLDIQGDEGKNSPAGEKKKTAVSADKNSASLEKRSPGGFQHGCKREMLARFERALIELQFLGFVKKNGEHVRCLVFND